MDPEGVGAFPDELIVPDWFADAKGAPPPKSV